MGRVSTALRLALIIMLTTAHGAPLRAGALGDAVFSSAPATRTVMSPWLRHRVKTKLRRWTGRSASVRDGAIREASSLLSGGAEPTEICAFYVDERLDEGQIAALKAEGIDVTELWVPPVPGHHPRGFHVVRTPVTAFETLSACGWVKRIDTLERRCRAFNDLAAIETGVDDVWAGVAPTTVGTATTGVGVRVAIADSGYDGTHPDLPSSLIEGYDVTTGDGPSGWSSDLTERSDGDGHGTHVAGTLCGNGSASGGLYRGVASGVSLAFYKVEDADGGIATADIVKAITRAQALGCKVMNLSLGTLGGYRDGSDAIDQTVDAAAMGGMLCVCAAGNEAGAGRHASAELAGGATSRTFEFTVDNTDGSVETSEPLLLVVLWRDGTPGDANVSIRCLNLGAGESLAVETNYYPSDRGTEVGTAELTVALPAGSSKTYQFVAENAPGASSTLVHVFAAFEGGSFATPDDSSIVTSPALADSALAVGAMVHRTTWTDHLGGAWMLAGETLGQAASFSSPGPRIDGRRKPEVAAPGTLMISCLAGSIIVPPERANQIIQASAYIGYGGTSMASPHVAGIAALLIEAAPWLTPSQLKEVLVNSARNVSNPDDVLGAGCVDVVRALAMLPGPPNPVHEVPGGCCLTPSSQGGGGGGLVLFMGLLLVGLFGRRGRVQRAMIRRRQR